VKPVVGINIKDFESLRKNSLRFFKKKGSGEKVLIILKEKMKLITIEG